MLRKTPPLAAAEAFLAAANAPSFRAAAEQLALSPSAFSRRIQMLERFVNAPLFDRSGPAVALTEKGRAYREAIEPALLAIRDATMQMRGGDGSEPLRLSASQSFAVDWLMPRLADLRERCDVAIDLVVSTGVQSLRKGEADLAIVGGIEEPADFDSDILIELDAVLVAAQRLSNGRPRPTCVAEIAGHDLLAMKAPPNIWRRWLAEVGHPEFETRTAARYESSHVMYEAAANGLGLTLATPLASERYLRDRRLSVCLPERRRIGMNYRLVYRTAQAGRAPAARRFRDWLDAEIRRSDHAFQQAAERGA
jgi:LysR family transcriptional regulator, glycine cleavage system transcriptional activator